MVVLCSSVDRINEAFLLAGMLYNMAATENSAALAKYERLMSTARVIRDYPPPTGIMIHADGPQVISCSPYYNTPADISPEELLPSLKFLDDHLVMNDQRST